MKTKASEIFNNKKLDIHIQFSYKRVILTYTKVSFHETFYSCLGSHAKRYYEKLQVLEFDSTRKRMSVILRDVDKDEIILFTKGAESSIIPR